ncbi:hypothetical protein ACFO0N_04020 [Halobium salinum]|uniref:Major facilitator superfamily (MFS) profile domain-containing protein n=1 Tax=Halobium salinum TaxID=1364940 RepID=A0ABD5P8T0_9EURY|nr:hypothetical protein [Halobium salinum]
MTSSRVGLGLLNLLGGLLTAGIAVFFALGAYVVAVGTDAITLEFVLFAVALLTGLFGFAFAFVPAVVGWLARGVSDAFVARTSTAGLVFAGLSVFGVALGGLTATAVAVSAAVAALLAIPLALNVLVVRSAARRDAGGDDRDDDDDDGGGGDPLVESGTGAENGLRPSV